jgi:hypothetical protein
VQYVAAAIAWKGRDDQPGAPDAALHPIGGRTSIQDRGNIAPRVAISPQNKERRLYVWQRFRALPDLTDERGIVRENHASEVEERLRITEHDVCIAKQQKIRPALARKQGFGTLERDDAAPKATAVVEEMAVLDQLQPINHLRQRTQKFWPTVARTIVTHDDAVDKTKLRLLGQCEQHQLQIARRVEVDGEEREPGPSVEGIDTPFWQQSPTGQRPCAVRVLRDDQSQDIPARRSDPSPAKPPHTTTVSEVAGANVARRVRATRQSTRVHPCGTPHLLAKSGEYP